MKEGNIMEPLHSAGDIYDVKAGGVALILLFIIILMQISAGHWDHILEHAVSYFPLWRWGG